MHISVKVHRHVLHALVGPKRGITHLHCLGPVMWDSYAQRVVVHTCHVAGRCLPVGLDPCILAMVWAGVLVALVLVCGPTALVSAHVLLHTVCCSIAGCCTIPTLSSRAHSDLAAAKMNGCCNGPTGGQLALSAARSETVQSYLAFMSR